MIQDATSVEELQYSGKPVVVCFTNPLTCAPCKAFKPHFEAAAMQMDGEAEFREVDVLSYMDVAQEFGVSGTPTVLLIDGNGVHELNSRTSLPLVNEISELI